MPVTFIRTTPLPKCRICGKRMDYYIPTMKDEDHAHTECEAEEWAEETVRILANAINVPTNDRPANGGSDE